MSNFQIFGFNRLPVLPEIDRDSFAGNDAEWIGVRTKWRNVQKNAIDSNYAFSCQRAMVITLFVISIFYAYAHTKMAAKPIPTEKAKALSHKFLKGAFAVMYGWCFLGGIGAIAFHIYQRKERANSYRTQLHELKDRADYHHFTHHTKEQVTTILELLNHNPPFIIPA